MPRQSLLNIALLDRKMVNFQELFIDYSILIQGQDFLANLYKFELRKFDVILGMD